MREWHIWDFPDTSYIYLNDSFRKEFFEQIFKKLSGKRPAARFLGVSQKTLNDYFKGYTLKNNTKHRQSISIGFLKKASSLIDSELHDEIENNIYLIKAKKKGIPIISPILPFKESCEFYRITAHMIGDGCAAKNKVPYYANKCDNLRKQFEEDLKVFGICRTYTKETKTVPVIFFPKVVTDILSFILNLKFTNPCHVPKIIFNASDEHKASFLQALFDDEGTISTNLAIYMVNAEIIKEIQELTESLNISTGNFLVKKEKIRKDNFGFSVKRSAFSNFKNKIGFMHPDKLKRLDNAINTKNRKLRTRNASELNEKIIKILKEKPRVTIEIADNIQLTLIHTLIYLKKLEKEGIVIRSGFKNKIIWSLSKV
jgi:hypothetical protein